MTTTALAVTELQARAFALDSALTSLRLEIERNRDLLAVLKYKRRCRKEFDRLQRALDFCWQDLTYHQLVRVAELLEMAELVNPLESYPERRWIERQVYRGICAIERDVAALLERLRTEALLRSRLTVNPRLSGYHAQQAAFAKVFLRPVTPDPAEGLADPDYGF